MKIVVLAPDTMISRVAEVLLRQKHASINAFHWLLLMSLVLFHAILLCI